MLVKKAAIFGILMASMVSIDAQARIFGLLAESETEKIKIEAVGPAKDAMLRVSFNGLRGVPLTASMDTGFVSTKGDVSFQEIAGVDFRASLIVALRQDIGEFYKRADRFSEISKGMTDENAKRELESNMLGSSDEVRVLSLKEDILKKVIRPEHLEDAYRAVVEGRLPLVFAIQEMKAGDYDYSLKYVRVNPSSFRMMILTPVYYTK